MSERLERAESSVRHGYAQVGDVRLHYAESGEGERLVLLLHGFPECWYSWRHQLQALGGRFRVVAPDLRGYNLSDKPPRVEDYRLERLVDDVTGLIRHFGARDAAIVGHDWGAVIAWATARRYPDCVWKLAALQVPPSEVWAKNSSLRQTLRSWYMFFFQLPYVPEWWLSRDDFSGLDSMFRSTSRPGTFDDADLAVFKAALRERGALQASINYYRANLWPLLRAASHASEATAGFRIRVPTLFIYGERDRFIIPETVEGIGAYVAAPYGELRLASGNHWVQQEYPAEVSAALLKFLEE